MIDRILRVLSMRRSTRCTGIPEYALHDARKELRTTGRVPFALSGMNCRTSSALGDDSSSVGCARGWWENLHIDRENLPLSLVCAISQRGSFSLRPSGARCASGAHDDRGMR